jgi:DNA-binding transcriptional MocR family regulator
VRSIRLSFSVLPVDDTHEGVRRLAAVILDP